MGHQSTLITIKEKTQKVLLFETPSSNNYPLPHSSFCLEIEYAEMTYSLLGG